MKHRLLKLSFLVGSIFFVFGILTLTHYGINWDTINHLPRGQAYLRYFLTGKKDYSGMPKFKLYWQKEDTLLYSPDVSKKDLARVSMYQEASGVDFNWFMKNDGGGHPPLSDILASFFNYVLFQKLGIMNDIDSYRVYGVLLASALVALVFYWSSLVYGEKTGFVSALVLGTYPLFWAESHFNNEKDIPEAVYWSFLIFSIWKGITTKSFKWIIISGVFFGLAFGTKFNILFFPFVILPWLLVYFLRKIIRKKQISRVIKQNLFILPSSILAFFIGIAIFIFTWPYLWPDFIGRVGTVFSFYQDIGTTSLFHKNFVGVWGTNTYPIKWIIYTTPPIVLFLSLFGTLLILLTFWKKRNATSFLWLMWLFVPILRVTMPGTNVYGGIRQIMEYIPALSLVSGAGFYYLSKRISNMVLTIFIIIGLAIPIVKYHPYENTYFNFLIGGLKGAKEIDFPFWGFTFGSAYREGAHWINQNAPKDSKVVYTYELLPNIPRIWLRSDLKFFNIYRSGYLRQGEYVITLTSQGWEKRSYYDKYMSKFVKPLYEAKVDNISVMSVWKNSEENLYQPWNEAKIIGSSYVKTKFGLRFDLGKIVNLSRLEINYRDGKCEPLKEGWFEVSTDVNRFNRLPGVLPNDWAIPAIGEQPKGGKFTQPFAGDTARYVSFIMSPVNNCLLNMNNYIFYEIQ